jgi:protein-disulfide isomerase
MAAILIGAAIGLGWMASRAKGGPAGEVEPGTPLPPAKGFTMGDSSAPVHVTEYADFECPSCGQFATVTEPDVRKRLVATGQVYYRYMDFPLPMHQHTWAASHAAHCAGEQGKFWEMHDRIYMGQLEWNGQATSNPKNVFESYATGIGADVKQWEECYDSGRHRLQIAANKRSGENANVNSTPTFIIGTRIVAGALAYDQFKALVDSAAAAGAGRGR